MKLFDFSFSFLFFFFTFTVQHLWTKWRGTLHILTFNVCDAVVKILAELASAEQQCILYDNVGCCDYVSN